MASPDSRWTMCPLGRTFELDRWETQELVFGVETAGTFGFRRFPFSRWALHPGRRPRASLQVSWA